VNVEPRVRCYRQAANFGNPADGRDRDEMVIIASMKFGRIKRQHGRVGGLDEILDRIVKHCPHVSRIVPGRIKVRRGKTPPSFKVQYPTDAGLKCLYTGTGTVQEVFLICSDSQKAKEWLIAEEIAVAEA
jgi:hypothetical protein